MGTEEKAGSDCLQLTFPEGIRRNTTDDSVGFKHRSAFYLGGKFYRLKHLEHLCNIEVMSAADQLKFQSTTSIKKAQSYSMQRAKKREWAHMSQDRCRQDQKKKILKMMIPYWHNSADYYNVFMRDIASACKEAKVSLGPACEDGVVCKAEGSGAGSTAGSASNGNALVVW